MPPTHLPSQSALTCRRLAASGGLTVVPLPLPALVLPSSPPKFEQVSSPHSHVSLLIPQRLPTPPRLHQRRQCCQQTPPDAHGPGRLLRQNRAPSRPWNHPLICETEDIQQLPRSPSKVKLMVICVRDVGCLVISLPASPLPSPLSPHPPWCTLPSLPIFSPLSSPSLLLGPPSRLSLVLACAPMGLSHAYHRCLAPRPLFSGP